MENEVREFGYRTPRVRADFHVWIEVGENASHVLDAHCHDLGENGLAADVAASLEVGARVTFVFTLPHSSTSFHLAGRVISRNEFTYGFAFIYSSQTEHDLLNKCLVCLSRKK